MQDIIKSLEVKGLKFSGICTDTRKIKKGDLFVALKGPNFDGHDFAQEAIRKGASGVVLIKNPKSQIRNPKQIPNPKFQNKKDLDR